VLEGLFNSFTLLADSFDSWDEFLGDKLLFGEGAVDVFGVNDTR